MAISTPPVQVETSALPKGKGSGFTPPEPKIYAKDKRVAERALKHVLASLSAAESLRGSLREHWQENYYAWRAIRNRKAYHGTANVVDPEPGRAVETISARLEEALLARGHLIHGLP